MAATPLDNGGRRAAFELLARLQIILTNLASEQIVELRNRLNQLLLLASPTRLVRWGMRWAWKLVRFVFLLGHYVRTMGSIARALAIVYTCTLACLWIVKYIRVRSIEFKARIGRKLIAWGRYQDIAQRWIEIAHLTALMKIATTYDEWKCCAQRIDFLEGRDHWKEKDEDPCYDHKRIAHNLTEMTKLMRAALAAPPATRERDFRVSKLIEYLRPRIIRNLGGIDNQHLYTYLKAGTKNLIIDFLGTVRDALEFIKSEGLERDPKEAFQFFAETRHVMGRSALLLSGGATMGFYHAGVIKALNDNGLLPRIVAGSSAGSIFAAIVGTSTDEELSIKLGDGKLMDLQVIPSAEAIEPSWYDKVVSWLQGYSLYPSYALEASIKNNVGEETFREAFDRTGRITNIAVTPRHRAWEQPRLLNHITAPNVCIYSAALASCAIPGVFDPVQLRCKEQRTGKFMDYYTPGVKWSDGSLQSDLPMGQLAQWFDVQYHIVSQVNPHVVPLIAPLRILGSSESWLFIPIQFLGRTLRDMLKNIYLTPFGKFGLIRYLHDLIVQNYFGNVTLFPSPTLSDLNSVLANLSPVEFDSRRRIAELYTFRQMDMIRSNCAIEVLLEECYREMKDHVESLKIAGLAINRVNSFVPSDNTPASVRESKIFPIPANCDGETEENESDTQRHNLVPVERFCLQNRDDSYEAVVKFTSLVDAPRHTGMSKAKSWSDHLFERQEKGSAIFRPMLLIQKSPAGAPLHKSASWLTTQANRPTRSVAQRSAALPVANPDVSSSETILKG